MTEGTFISLERQDPIILPHYKHYTE